MRMKKGNDIFAYFEVIEKLEPASILDAGMFLKRVGSVSRQMMNRKVPRKILLEGIDIFPEVSFIVWENIYNKTYFWQEFSAGKKQKQYDLGVILGSDAWKERLGTEELFREMKCCCAYFLLDSYARNSIKDLSGGNLQEIKVEGDVYYFIDNK